MPCGWNNAGPKPTLVAGAAMVCLGYLLMYFALSLGQRYSWTPSLAAGAWFLVGHGSGWIYISTLFTNAMNFAPHQRGKASGAMY